MTTLPFTVCAGKGSSSLLHFERYRNEIDGLGGIIQDREMGNNTA